MDKREIPWAPGYFVHSDGQVQSPSGKFLKPQQIDGRGYMRVWPGSRPVRLHRLVAELFVVNDHGHPEVNHIDGNETNNAACNLQWCSRHENMRHAVRTGLKMPKYGETAPNAKLSSEQVAGIRRDYKKGQSGFGCAAIADRYGCDPKNVWLIVNGKARTEG
jgi:hypothetical protein